VLARLNRDDDAIAQFLALTQAYPELPEPYNNLAALYAKHGRYDDARAALVTATQANPDYSLAYENLGDLYLRLASESYKRARSLGRTSGASAQRLADIERIIAPPAAAQQAAQQAKADKPAAASRAEGVSADATSNLSTITPPQQSNFEFNGGGGATLATPPYVAPSH
jgi:tetratricopeptide (TPR) repeat protein